MTAEKETNNDGEACPLRFDIGGMHCAACSSRIERVVGRMDGVDKISVNLPAATAKIWVKPGEEEAVRKAVMERVAALGFSATPAADVDAATQYETARAKAL